jgi:hypothetical protein
MYSRSDLALPGRETGFLSKRFIWNGHSHTALPAESDNTGNCSQIMIRRYEKYRPLLYCMVPLPILEEQLISWVDLEPEASMQIEHNLVILLFE